MIKTQKPITFINDCDAIVDYKELEKAIIWYQDKPTASIKHIYLHGNYPAVSIRKEKIHIHRLLWMYWTNNKNLEYSCSVHHKDKNKLNALRENLVEMNSSEHQSVHHKGRKVPQSQIDRLIAFNHTRKNTRFSYRRPDVTCEEVYALKQQGWSINAIAKHFDVDWRAVKARLNDVNNNTELMEGQ